jgi:hypothetical protein
MGAGSLPPQQDRRCQAAENITQGFLLLSRYSPNPGPL